MTRSYLARRFTTAVDRLGDELYSLVDAVPDLQPLGLRQHVDELLRA